jgi:glucokinase
VGAVNSAQLAGISETKTMVGAVDIGGTKIAVGIVADDGRLLARQECPTCPDEGYQAALARAERMLRQVIESSTAKIVGIGIGSTGPVDPFTGEIGDVNFFPSWRGANPVKDLAERFQVPVAMENDADAAALGEAGWGTGRNIKRMVYVTVGTGIGGGMIFDGQLYRGVDRSHPEIGHHVIDASGPACMCGFRGCWESLAAGPAMTKWMEEQIATGHPHHGNLTAKRICEMARAGDALAQRAVDREAYYLGLGFANLVTLFTPDAIVLGGSVMKSADLFLPGIHKLIRESCRFVPFERVKLALASLGDDTNLIGAARVWHHRFTLERGTSA